MARFNYDMYLSLSPTGGAVDAVRSGILRVYAAGEQWGVFDKYFQAAPAETRWSDDALEILFDRLSDGTDRASAARKLLSNHAAQDLRRLEILMFLYRHAQDGSARDAWRGPGAVPAYSKLAEAAISARP